MKPPFSSFHFTFISAFIQEWGYSFDSKYQRCRVKCLTLPLPKVHLNLEPPTWTQDCLALPLAWPLSCYIPNYILSKTSTSSHVCWFQQKYKKKFRKAPFRENVPITSSGDLTFSKYTQIQLQCVCCVNLVRLCWNQQMWSRFAALSWN